MSKKGKLILATALFGAALFGASCGGGGGGEDATASAPPSPPSPPPAPPAPTVEGRVLALLNLGTPSAGTFMPVTICELRSDNKAHCGNDLNPTADANLEYLYEFPNGNVVLKDSANKIYFFNGSQVIKLDKFRPLGASSSTPETPAPGGSITIPNLTNPNTMVYATPNFVIVVNNSSTNTLVVITSSGKVIKDTDNTDKYTPDTSCEVVTKGTNTTYKLNPDGSSTTTTIPTTLASAGGKFLVQSGNDIFLSNSRCSASGVVVDTISNANDAKMVKVGDDFYIAVRVDEKLRYYKVTGNTVTPLNTGITLADQNPTEYYYALDGKGRLYAITATGKVSVYNIDGTQIGSDLSITNVAGLLGLADRVLAKDTQGGKAYEITITGSTASAVDKGSTLFEVVDKCTDTNTKSVDGAGTNFIRCVYSNSSTTLHSLTYDSGSGLYRSASSSMLSGAFGGVLFAPNKVLVKAGTTIHLCNTTTTPTISCSSTDLPSLDLTDIKAYLKSNGNNVFYVNSSDILKVGDIFGTTSPLPITVSDPTGGNASFDLNRFAFSFTPAVAQCATQIVYLSSRTASPKTYTIAQPSNACVARILKVY